MITVKATREGLIGNQTASGYLIDAVVPFVALPARAALNCWVRLYNPANGKTCRALVLDVGPWNIHDHGYVFQPRTTDRWGLPNRVTTETVAAPGAVRPQAESGMDHSGRVTNRAGIDLGEAVWKALDMQGNTDVSWEFD